MRDYRLPAITGRRPVVVAKKKEISEELIEIQDKSTEKREENLIYLTLSDSVGTKESFG